ncbi:MAG TPA: Asp-tRNA(Asn)/Glu-tRNA(Gln) amidotransferase subunit GatB [Chloroflexota bacterium]|nr:Asp-tRNA(Asn)/Glu-tRNA(Gln) amidotransferase subunit GatB [Chloroflexota bacterium]
MDYEPTIGLEVHVQVQTESKMFCACPARYAEAAPNSNVCPICLGMPGVLPVINRRAVEYTILTALALNCEIPEFSKFDRKNYNYPDLMKGYQISQYDLPFSRNGWLEIADPANPEQTRRLGITRVHLEEDTANLKHVRGASGEAYSLMDCNRAGSPLMEIVGEPDIRTAEEAGAYLRQLRAIVRYIGVSTGNMEEGALRCDANVSVRPVGSSTLGAKVEVKNMNSFRAVERAIAFEIDRQVNTLREGGRIVQETRGWVEERAVTVSQRSKEEAHDYRYFPEPDLPPLFIERAWVDEIRAKLPELPEPKRRRFMERYGLTAQEASTLTGSRSLADYYEAALAAGAAPRPAANWILRDVLRLLGGASIESSKMTPAHVAQLTKLVESGTLSVRSAPEVLEESFRTGADPEAVVREKGLTQVSDTGELEGVVDRVLAAPQNARAVADYKAGKAASIGFLVGAVMKETRGKANPGLVNQLLKQKLDG